MHKDELIAASLACLTQWEMRQHGSDRASAKAATRAYMRTMPAWRDHPGVQNT